MKKFKREARYLSVLVVHVPDMSALVDMMRYDRCVPLDEDESRKLWRLLGADAGGKEADKADHVVRLLRLAAADVPATEGRWRSFGCRVLDERSPDAPQLSDAEILNLAKVTQ